MKDTKTQKNNTICKNCGAIVPQGHKQCIICGQNIKDKSKKIGDKPSPKVDLPVSPRQLQKQKVFPKFVSGVLILCFIAGSFVVSIFEYAKFQNLKSYYNTKDSILYQTVNNELKIHLGSGRESILISKDFASTISDITAAESYDKRFVGYLDNQAVTNGQNSGELILIDLIQLDAENSRQRPLIKLTSSRIVDFAFSKTDNSIAYLTEGGELFYCDYSPRADIVSLRRLDIISIDSDVKGIVELSGENVIYYKGENVNAATLGYNRQNSDGKGFSLYKAKIDSLPKIAQIDNNVYDVVDSYKDSTRALYTKLTSRSPSPVFSLYSYNSGLTDPVTLIDTNVSHIVEAVAETGEVAYLKANDHLLSFNDLFVDDLSLSDNAIKKPAEPADTVEGEPAGESPEYIAQLQRHEEKLLRDKLRYHVASSIRRFNQSNYLSHTLMLKPGYGNEPYAIDKNIYNLDTSDTLVYGDLKDHLLLYVSSVESFPKKTISEMSTDDIENIVNSTMDIQSYLAENLPETLTLFSTSLEQPLTVYTETGDKVISHYSLSSDGGEIYFISKSDFESNNGTLYYTSFSGSAIDKIIYVDDYVYSIVGNMGGNDPGIVYQAVSRENPDDFSLYKSSASGVSQLATKTDKAPYVKIFGSDNSKLYFYRNYSSSSQNGNLYFFENYEALIAQDIHEFTKYSKNNLILVQDNASGSYALLSYFDENISLIDNGVKSYITFDGEFLP